MKILLVTGIILIIVAFIRIPVQNNEIRCVQAPCSQVEYIPIYKYLTK